MPHDLSPTRLNLFAECPRCFWLRVVEGVERPSRPFPSLPGGMDRAIEAHFDRHRAAGTLPPALDGAVDAVLEPDGELLERCRRWQADPCYRDEPNDVVLRGALDDLLRAEDGSLVVLDYKTRGYPPRRASGAPDYYARQLTCYALMLESAGHQTAQHGFLLYYYPDSVGDDGTARFHTELRRVPVDVGRIEATVARAAETLDGPIPDYEPNCAFCAWHAAEHG